MQSLVVAVPVVTLLLPGLVMLFAIVIRYALRGGPAAVHRPDADNRTADR